MKFLIIVAANVLSFAMSYFTIKALIALVVMLGVVVGSPLYLVCVIGICVIDIVFFEAIFAKIVGIFKKAAFNAIKERTAATI